MKIIKKNYETTVSVDKVRKFMKQEMGLRYRMTRKVPQQANTQRCLVLRQQYAMKMLELLKEDTLIINIDESWINETNYIRKLWLPPNSPGTVPIKAVSHRLSLITALDSEGRIYYSLT